MLIVHPQDLLTHRELTLMSGLYCSPVRQTPIKESKMAGNQEKTAMKKRKWDAQTKAMVVLQGLKGKPVAEICQEHQINQNLYYKWRDQFLANMDQVFVDKEKITEKLNSENKHLRKIIGDLTVELKKTEEWLK